MRGMGGHLSPANCGPVYFGATNTSIVLLIVIVIDIAITVLCTDVARIKCAILLIGSGSGSEPAPGASTPSTLGIRSHGLQPPR